MSDCLELCCIDAGVEELLGFSACHPDAKAPLSRIPLIHNKIKQLTTLMLLISATYHLQKTCAFLLV